MKIDPTNVTGTITGAAASQKGAQEPVRVEKDIPGEKTVEVTPPAGSKDQVQLSSLLETLRRAASGDEITTERAAHLEKLADQVANGEYQVDSNQLSAKLVEDTLRGIA